MMGSAMEDRCCDPVVDELSVVDKDQVQGVTISVCWSIYDLAEEKFIAEFVECVGHGLFVG